MLGNVLDNVQSVHSQKSEGVMLTNLYKLMYLYLNKLFERHKEKVCEKNKNFSDLETLLSGNEKLSDLFDERLLIIIEAAKKLWQGNNLYGLYLYLQDQLKEIQKIQTTEKAKIHLMIEQVFPTFADLLKALFLAEIDNFLSQQKELHQKVKDMLLKPNDGIDLFKAVVENNSITISRYEMIRPEMGMALVMRAVQDKEAFKHDEKISEEKEQQLRNEGVYNLINKYYGWRTKEIEGGGGQDCNRGLLNAFLELLQGTHTHILDAVPDLNIIIRNIVLEWMSEEFGKLPESTQLQIIFSENDVLNENDDGQIYEKFLKDFQNGEKLQLKLKEKINSLYPKDYLPFIETTLNTVLESYAKDKLDLLKEIDYIPKNTPKLRKIWYALAAFDLGGNLSSIQDPEVPLFKFAKISLENFKNKEKKESSSVAEIEKERWYLAEPVLQEYTKDGKVNLENVNKKAMSFLLIEEKELSKAADKFKYSIITLLNTKIEMTLDTLLKKFTEEEELFSEALYKLYQEEFYGNNDLINFFAIDAAIKDFSVRKEHFKKAEKLFNASVEKEPEIKIKEYVEKKESNAFLDISNQLLNSLIFKALTLSPSKWSDDLQQNVEKVIDLLKQLEKESLEKKRPLLYSKDIAKWLKSLLQISKLTFLNNKNTLIIDKDIALLLELCPLQLTVADLDVFCYEKSGEPYLTSLHLVCNCGVRNLSLIKEIYKKNPEALLQPIKNGETPFHWLTIDELCQLLTDEKELCTVFNRCLLKLIDQSDVLNDAQAKKIINLLGKWLELKKEKNIKITLPENLFTKNIQSIKKIKQPLLIHWLFEQRPFNSELIKAILQEVTSIELLSSLLAKLCRDIDKDEYCLIGIQHVLKKWPDGLCHQGKYGKTLLHSLTVDKLCNLITEKNLIKIAFEKYLEKIQDQELNFFWGFNDLKNILEKCHELKTKKEIDITLPDNFLTALGGNYYLHFPLLFWFAEELSKCNVRETNENKKMLLVCLLCQRPFNSELVKTMLQEVTSIELLSFLLAVLCKGVPTGELSFDGIKLVVDKLRQIENISLDKILLTRYFVPALAPLNLLCHKPNKIHLEAIEFIYKLCPEAVFQKTIDDKLALHLLYDNLKTEGNDIPCYQAFQFICQQYPYALCHQNKSGETLLHSLTVDKLCNLIAEKNSIKIAVEKYLEKIQDQKVEVFGFNNLKSILEKCYELKAKKKIDIILSDKFLTALKEKCDRGLPLFFWFSEELSNFGVQDLSFTKEIYRKNPEALLQPIKNGETPLHWLTIDVLCQLPTDEKKLDLAFNNYLLKLINPGKLLNTEEVEGIIKLLGKWFELKKSKNIEFVLPENFFGKVDDNRKILFLCLFCQRPFNSELIKAILQEVIPIKLLSFLLGFLCKGIARDEFYFEGLKLLVEKLQQIEIINLDNILLTRNFIPAPHFFQDPPLPLPLHILCEEREIHFEAIKFIGGLCPKAASQQTEDGKLALGLLCHKVGLEKNVNGPCHQAFRYIFQLYPDALWHQDNRGETLLVFLSVDKLCNLITQKELIKAFEKYLEKIQDQEVEKFGLHNLLSILQKRSELKTMKGIDITFPDNFWKALREKEYCERSLFSILKIHDSKWWEKYDINITNDIEGINLDEENIITNKRFG